MTATSTRKPTNISLDAKLLSEARELDVNVSRACEVGLADEVRKRRWAKWQEDNREAIETYNRYVATHGLASEYFHDFGNGIREDKESDGSV